MLQIFLDAMTIQVAQKAVPVKKPSYKKNYDEFYGRFPDYKVTSKGLLSAAEKNNDSDTLVWSKLVKPHVESFNWFTTTGLDSLPNAVPAQYMRVSSTENDQRLRIGIETVTLDKPQITGSSFPALYPAETRQRKTTYGSKLQVKVYFELWRGEQTKHRQRTSFPLTFSEVPVMLGSNLCNISQLSPYQKVLRGEEPRECGGYFICNGNEKVIRMLCLPRRNIPTGLARKSFKKRGANFTEYGSTCRSVDRNLHTKNLVVHYLNGGDCSVSIYYKNIPLTIPIHILLMSLLEADKSPAYLVDTIVRGEPDALFLASRVRSWLTKAEDETIFTGKIARAKLGKQLRGLILYQNDGLPSWWTFEEFGQYVIDTCILPHLDDNVEKLRFLALMIRQVFGLALGTILPDNADSTSNHEVLLPGHLMHAILVDRLDAMLNQIRLNVEKKILTIPPDNLIQETWMKKICTAISDPAKPLNYLLATGNLKTSSQTLLGLQQASGLAVTADKINMARFLSHFRCIHRGSFFQQMRTTEARKLLPEYWGFICPVHTPDGGACGLLQHIASLCEVTNWEISETESTGILDACRILGMRDVTAVNKLGPPSQRTLPVLLDGKVVGWIAAASAKRAAETLRTLKTLESHNIPKNIEIVYRPLPSGTDKNDHVRVPFPGVFLLTEPARLIRPVYNLRTESVEMIGSLEQIWLKINLQKADSIEQKLEGEELTTYHGPYTHQEVSIQGFLSACATMTPFSDMDQSARAMYQCGMLKQTMGNPGQSLSHRTDTKMYRIQSGQSPLDRCYHYDHYGFDEYYTGTNAIVAVISYTGEDMEDAIILNKSAVERGIHYGTVYKTKYVNLLEGSNTGRGRFMDKSPFVFGFVNSGSAIFKKFAHFLNKDGLPYVGRVLKQGSPLYCYTNFDTGVETVENWRENYDAIVESVKALGNDKGSRNFTEVAITLRIQRPPTVGDKFAARHGQKGTCSRLWNVENLPWTESGMVPDMIFNPHGFPTRMTVGMMVEVVCGKAAAVHADCYDTSPFVFNEKHTAAQYFGEVLTKAGYDFYGTERMFSGISGEMLSVWF